MLLISVGQRVRERERKERGRRRRSKGEGGEEIRKKRREGRGEGQIIGRVVVLTLCVECSVTILLLLTFSLSSLPSSFVLPPLLLSPSLSIPSSFLTLSLFYACCLPLLHYSSLTHC